MSTDLYLKNFFKQQLVSDLCTTKSIERLLIGKA